MPTLQDWQERIDLLTADAREARRELDRVQAGAAELRYQLDEAIAGNAKVIRALDAAVQWGEALFAFLPEGTVLPEGAKTAMSTLREALKDVRR